jgi:Protein of unknown function (DUF2934)
MQVLQEHSPAPTLVHRPRAICIAACTIPRDFPTFSGHNAAVEWPRPAGTKRACLGAVYRFQEMSMEMTPEGSPAKRTKSKVIVKPAASEAPVAKKPRAPRKTLTTKTATAMAAESSSEDVGGMIATAAYYLAAARNFTPGHELDDWLEAERSIRAKLYG